MIKACESTCVYEEGAKRIPKVRFAVKVRSMEQSTFMHGDACDSRYVRLREEWIIPYDSTVWKRILVCGKSVRCEQSCGKSEYVLWKTLKKQKKLWKTYGKIEYTEI